MTRVSSRPSRTGLAVLVDRGLHGDLARRADAQPDGPVAGLEGRAVRMRGLMMGGWFVATAIGNKLTVDRRALDQVVSFVVLAALLAVCAGHGDSCSSALLRPLKRAMPGV